MKKKEFKCDICDKTYPSAQEMKRMILPGRFYKTSPRKKYEGTDTIVTVSVTACRNCLQKTMDLLETKMAVGFYDLDGTEVSWKK